MSFHLSKDRLGCIGLDVQEWENGRGKSSNRAVNQPSISIEVKFWRCNWNQDVF